MKEFAFVEQAVRHLNEFTLNIMQSKLVLRVLRERIEHCNDRIKIRNKNEELYLRHEDLINELHAEAVDLENIASYMLFVINGDKTWTVKSQKDMRIRCALMRKGLLDVSPVLTYGEQPQIMPGCRCFDSPIFKEDDK